MLAVHRWPFQPYWEDESSCPYDEACSIGSLLSASTDGYGAESQLPVPPNTEFPSPQPIGAATLSARRGPLVDDSAYMPGGNALAQTCIEEAARQLQSVASCTVIRETGAETEVQARETTVVTNDPAQEISQCPEVSWRMAMGWFYGCRY